jgi:uncharacterized protein YjfI (DUF2170 family)
MSKSQNSFIASWSHTMELELNQRITAVAARLEEVLGAVDIERITGEVSVYKLTVSGREELPMFVTQAQSQLLCICYLWTEAEINPMQRTALLEAMLDLNVAIPLSSFGRIGEKYILHGALACDAGVDDLTTDLLALSDNAVDALVAMADYLI